MPEHPTDAGAGVVVLDREEREALRRELRLAAMDCGDINLMLDGGMRQLTMARLERLQGIAAVLDAIGWSEVDGAPDRQPVTVTPATAAWLSRNADELVVSLAEMDGEDIDLLALAVMRKLAPM